MKRSTLLLLLLTTATLAGAQTVHQQGYWTRAYLRLKVGPHWAWHSEVDEFMISMHDFDQNRLYAGAEYQLGAGFAAELGYLKLWQNRLLRPDNYNRDVLRFTLYKDVTLLAVR